MIRILRKKLFKSVLWFSLFVFLPFAFGFDAYAQAKDLKEEAQSKKLSVILNSLEDKDFDEILNKAEEILEKDFSDDLRKDAFRTILSGLKERDKEIRKRFAQTEKTLKEKNLPPEILKRHKEFVEKYEERFKTFEGRVNSYTNSNWLNRSFSRNGLKGFIKENTYKRKIPELDPNKLPHRSKPVKEIQTEEYKPLEKKELKKIDKQDAQGLFLPSDSSGERMAESGTRSSLSNTLFAYAGDISMLPLLVSQSGNEYLQETMEVQFTSEIDSLATALEHDPIKIYEYVRNSFKYEPYYGSLKGAQETFYEKAGNDFDLASLLISLLRTSGIKARYVYGEIIVPIDKAMGWLGVLDPWVAGNIFATMGVPARMLVVDGKPYGLRMEHCWVEAQLNYDIDLGKINPVSKDTTWIPMDPSYKILEYNDPVNLEDEVPLNVDSLMQEINSSAIIDTITGAVTGMDTTIMDQALENYWTRTNNWIDENLGDSATFGDIFPFKWIKIKEGDGIAPVPPYKVTKVVGKYTGISENFRHQITIEIMSEGNIGTDVSYIVPTIEMYGKRALLAYTPSTSSDEELILSQFSDTLEDTTDIPSAIPAYLIKMRPQIVIEDQAVKTGSSINMGKEQQYKIIFHSPARIEDEITNTAIAGSMYSIGFAFSKIPHKIIQNRIILYEEINEKLNNQDISPSVSYDVIGELLNITTLLYYYQLDTYNGMFARKADVFRLRVPSEAIASLSVKVTSILGFPYAISTDGFKIDVDRDMEAVFGRDGENNRKKSYNIQSGIMGSELEARVLEQVFSVKNAKALSATRILSIANAQQIPIYTINSSNISQIFPLLQMSDKVKSAIECAVNGGMEVIVPGANIQYNGWEGVGYIAINPNTGEGAYMVEGEIGGGIWYVLWWIGYVFLWLCVVAGAICAGLLLLQFIPVLIAKISAMSLPLFIKSFWMTGDATKLMGQLLDYMRIISDKIGYPLCNWILQKLPSIIKWVVFLLGSEPNPWVQTLFNIQKIFEEKKAQGG